MKTIRGFNHVPKMSKGTYQVGGSITGRMPFVWPPPLDAMCDRCAFVISTDLLPCHLCRGTNRVPIPLKDVL